MASVMCVTAANYIIERTNEFNRAQNYENRILITGKRLQKILYFSDVEYMRRNAGDSMFTDEFYAWPSGPVIPSVYYEFAQYQNGEMSVAEGKHSDLTQSMVDAIDYVLERTNTIDTVDLIELSHVEGGPWRRFYSVKDPNHEQMIPKDEIYSFYKNREIFNTVL